MIVGALVFGVLHLAWAAAPQTPALKNCAGDKPVISFSDVTLSNAVFGKMMSVNYTLTTSQDVSSLFVHFLVFDGQFLVNCYTEEESQPGFRFLGSYGGYGNVDHAYDLPDYEAARVFRDQSAVQRCLYTMCNDTDPNGKPCTFAKGSYPDMRRFYLPVDRSIDGKKPTLGFAMVAFVADRTERSRRYLGCVRFQATVKVP